MTATDMLLAAAVGYLFGSVPSGLLLTRMAGLGDIRTIGSGNIGATNVLRTGSKSVAAATLAFDVLKGLLAVLIAPVITAATTTDGGWSVAHVAGLAAFLGHLFPVWLSFKGGKGVATYIGVLCGIWWPAAVTFCAVWLLTAVATRYSSLSALFAALAAPLAAGVFSLPPNAMLLTIISMLLIWKHHDNIRRLRDGEEPKIGAKS